MNRLRVSARAVVVVSVAAASIAMVNATATPAYAAPCEMVMSFSTASSTAEYGEYWSLPISGDANFYQASYTSGGLDISSTGTPSGYTPSLYIGDSGGNYAGNLNRDFTVQPLDPGSYTFTVSVADSWSTDSCASFEGSTVPAGALTISAAKLGIEARALSDANNPNAAIITAKFTGAYIDSYEPSFFEGAAISPAGTWKFVIKDAEGAVALERTIDRVAGDDVLATSFYWTEAEPDEQYSVAASFATSGTSATRFQVTDSAEFAYTAPPVARPVPVSTTPAQSNEDLAPPSEFSLPVWVYFLAAALLLASAVLTIVFAIRLRGREGPSPADPVSGPAEPKNGGAEQ